MFTTRLEFLEGLIQNEDPLSLHYGVICECYWRERNRLADMAEIYGSIEALSEIRTLTAIDCVSQ